MSHKNKVPLVDQVKQALDAKLAIGRSKHQDKLSEKESRRTVASEMRRKKVAIEDIQWYLGHNDEATTRTYILNNQGKQKTSKQIIYALSEMNGSHVLMCTQIARNEKSPEA